MKKSIYIILFILSLALSVIPLLLQNSPGYMDSEYYFLGGKNLAQGHGFSEWVIWNYLNNPGGLPTPSFTYWMPLPGILAAVGMNLFGTTSFGAARFPFWILSGFISPMTAFLGYQMTKKTRIAILAGVLAIFSGYYFIYQTITETFVISEILGLCILFIITRLLHSTTDDKFLWLRFGLLGILSGFFHLTRADGLVWLGISGLFWLYFFSKEFGKGRGVNKEIYLSLLVLLIGYMIPMGGWYFRNLSLYHQLFIPGTQHTLWLSKYDDLFAYPADGLSFQRWVSIGIGPILLARWEALVLNIKTLIGVQGIVFFTPMIVLGIYKYWQDVRIKIICLFWLVELIVMSIIFPFAGSRGGYFHSVAAIQPILWIMGAVGFEMFIDFGVNKRNWQLDRAWKMFGTAAIILMVSFTSIIYIQKVVGNDSQAFEWNSDDKNFRSINEKLNILGVDTSQIILVNNPPGFSLVTDRPAIVIPDGSIQTLFQVSERYQVNYLVLEANHVKGLDNLYNHPVSLPGLDYLESIDTAQIYRFDKSFKTDQ